jgi:hypothetical protein
MKKRSKLLVILGILGVLIVALVISVINLQNQTQTESDASGNEQRPGPNEGGGPANAVSEEVSPMVKITAPQANASVPNPVTITASIESNQAITRVEFWKDKDTTPFFETTSAPYETSVSLEPGRHRINVVAYDASENVKRSQEVSFTVK